MDGKRSTEQVSFAAWLLERADLTRCAVLGRGASLRYEELVERVGRMARLIAEHGFGSGDTVLLAAANGTFALTGYLAILWSGCRCALVDPAMPSVELVQLARRCGAKAAVLDATSADVDGITIFREVPTAGPVAAPVMAGADDPALVLFTSGSTGEKKGVVLSQRNLMSNTEAIVAYQRLGTEDVHEAVLPLHYCFGASVVHTHLRAGASLIFNNDFRFTNTVWEDVARFRVTGFSGVPAHYQILLRRCAAGAHDLSSLRFFAQAGGKLAEPFLRDLATRFPAVDIFVMYGQTEATARLAYLPPARLADKLGSVGIAVQGTELRVVDDRGGPVPAGGEGEILARGPNLMLGYLDDPEGTRERIRGGWLHTGDFGHMDADGYLYVHGRKEGFIKSAGHRIHPADVADALETHPHILEAAAEGVEDPVAGQAIKAYVVAATPNDPGIDSTTVIAWCRENLQPHLVPRVVEVVLAIPRTASGKRKAR